MIKGSQERVQDRSCRSVWDSPRLLDDLAWYPNEQIVRFIVKYLRKRTGLDSWNVRRPARTVLDLGCGTGRHVKLLTEQGFEAHGVDISFVGIRFARDWMRSLDYRANLVVGSSFELPYRAHRFDVVISHGVLDHMTFNEASRTAQELWRVLRSNGLLYLDLISKRDSGFGRGDWVGPDTFIVPDGIETGAVQRFYDEADIRALLGSAFVVQEIIFQEWYPVLGSGFSNLDKMTSEPLRLARFHVVATPRHASVSRGEGCGSL